MDLSLLQEVGVFYKVFEILYKIVTLCNSFECKLHTKILIKDL